ncbi:PLC-like phosphodiesterase [Auriculariales sp. MPI-PUGE-AT-0066]|nr:PLC-like phosphodiesterase [Auriculariales sp. MPI-PUGE-AT-0066]
MPPPRSLLDPEQLKFHLRRGQPILGMSGSLPNDGPLSSWMKGVEDARPLQCINMPGTHDSCSWNPQTIVRPILQNQQRPLLNQLRDGIRVLDLRFGGRDGALRLFHGELMLDSTAELVDILWGCYQFVESHPTEALLVFLKIDNGSMDAFVRGAIRNLLTSALARDFWLLDAAVRASNLGSCRGKMILLRRFEWDDGPLGIDLTKWPGMPLSGKFQVPYFDGQSAWIEDLFQFDMGSVAARSVTEAKWAALRDHLERAQKDLDPTSIYFGFASGAGQVNSHYVTPKTMAIGAHTGHPLSDTTGVNNILHSWVREQLDGQRRIGVILFDFYNAPTGLVEDIVRGQPPFS